jgi:hypothetical protein
MSGWNISADLINNVNRRPQPTQMRDHARRLAQRIGVTR